MPAFWENDSLSHMCLIQVEPRGESAAEAANDSGRPHPVPVRDPVVLVCDEPNVVAEVVAALASTGTRIDVVGSMPDCTEVLCALRPRTVIVDLGDSGYEGDTAWRARLGLDALWHCEPDVIALSRLSPAETWERASRIDAKLVLRAPFEFDRLVARLRALDHARAAA